MTPSTLKKAIAEAERFIRAAEAVPLSGELPTMDGKVFKYVQRSIAPDETFAPSKHSAAAKRASLDLTRALADLRRR